MKIEDLPVAELMNRNVLTVLPSTTLKDLISLMQKTHQHIFPVLADDATLLGVVNYNDILNIFRPFSRSVSEIVKRMPFVESADDEAAQPTPPRFLSHPNDVTVNEDESATFSVIAYGHPTPTYQWQRDGADIVGATGATYATPPATLADHGAKFRCVVRNSEGVAASRTGTLHVTSILPEFLRGDTNGDNTIDIADTIALLGHLFGGQSAPGCSDAADANDDEALDIADAIAILAHLFGGAGPLPEPFDTCGQDPPAVPPAVDELECLQYEPCE